MGGTIDTVYALDAEAMTAAKPTEGQNATGVQSEAAAPAPESPALVGWRQPENGELSRDRLLARACKSLRDGSSCTSSWLAGRTQTLR